MTLCTTSDTNRINPQEARMVRNAFTLAFKPGRCAKTLLAGIVASGSLQGLDLSQEATALEPELLATVKPMRLAHRGPMVADHYEQGL